MELEDYRSGKRASPLGVQRPARLGRTFLTQLQAQGERLRVSWERSCALAKTCHGIYAELLPGFLEETSSYEFEQVCALGSVVLPEVIE